MESHLKRHLKLYILIALAVFLVVYGSIFFKLYERNHRDWNSFITSAADSEGYLQLAENLKNHSVFSLSKSQPFIPETRATPGYPFFVFITELLFKSYLAVSVLQVLSVLASGYMIFKIGQKVISTTAGFFASLLFIFSADVILYTPVIMTDILYVFLSILSMYILFFRNGDSGKPRYIILGGLICGTAILTRPVGILLPFIFGAFLFIDLIKNEKRNLRSAFVSVLLLGLSVAVVVMPWVLRNKIVVGVWGISVTESFNFYFDNIPQYLCLKRDPSSCYDKKKMDDLIFSLAKAIGNYNTEIRPKDNPDMLSIKYSNAMTRESLRIISGDWIGFTSYYLKTTLPRFFFSSAFKKLSMDLRGNTSDTENNDLADFFYRGEYNLMWQGLKSQLAYTLDRIWLLLLIILCGLSLFKIRTNKFILMFLIIIAQYVLITGPTSYFRYRLPADPFIVICAMAGLWFLIDVFRRRFGNIKKDVMPA